RRTGFGIAAPGRVSARDCDGYLPGPVPDQFLDAARAGSEPAIAVQLRAAHGQPRVPRRPPHHGASAVELVSAVRPQPADLREEHLLRTARRLREGDPKHLPRAGPGELHRVARGADAMIWMRP